MIFASKGGAPVNPDWYHNLKAHPEVQVEVGSQSLPAIATEATGEERVRLFNEQARRSPQFGEYQQKTDRQIPVIILSPTPSEALRRVPVIGADAHRLISWRASAGDQGRCPWTRSRTSGFVTAPGNGRSSWASAVGYETVRTARPGPRRGLSRGTGRARRVPSRRAAASSCLVGRARAGRRRGSRAVRRSAVSAPARSSCRSTRRPRITSTCAWRLIA